MDETISKEIIISKLKQIIDPVSKKDIVDAEFLSTIVIKDNNVGFAIKANSENSQYISNIKEKCETILSSIKNIGKVTIVVTSDSDNKIKNDNRANFPVTRKIENVKNTIIVASGKGGVGKSTIAVNIANELNKQGYKVGILDIDIYGPSIPKMLNLSGQPELDETQKMVPLVKNGIKSMSIGYLISEENALVWRASMAIKSVNKLILGTNWGELDYLIIDTPPGTGDIHLSLCKNFFIDGAVLVTTAHNLALADVVKSLDMFNKLNISLLGIIENMSYFQDDSGKKNYIFGNSVIENFASQNNINLLDQIAIDKNLQDIDFESKDPLEEFNKTINKITA